MHRSDAEKYLAKFDTSVGKGVAQALVRLYERVASGQSLAAIFGDDEERLEGMLLLSLPPYESTLDEEPRSMIEAVTLYRDVAAENAEGCLVPRSLVPIARNEYHHFLLLAVAGEQEGGVYYHDTEGQGGILYDDWNDLTRVGEIRS